MVTHCRNLFSLITLPPLCHRPPRRLSDKGTLQLSIDTDSIRRALLEFPKAGRPLDEEGDTAAYTHYVEREMGQAINLVKVLQVRNGAAWHGGRWGGGEGWFVVSGGHREGHLLPQPPMLQSALSHPGSPLRFRPPPRLWSIGA